MLDASNRQALTQQLRPPAGFRLSHAIGTTFTLDMTSALSVPLSFVAGAGEEFTNPVAILSAIRKVSDRIDIFCQAGQIKVPADASDLLSLLEPMIRQVAVPRGLFHPKIWLLEFENDDERSYRFLCSSRNLTFDASWDLLVRLDGWPVDGAEGTGPDGAPLARFVKSLPDLCSVRPDVGRIAKINEFASRLRTVRWELPDGIQRVAFRPMGLGEKFESGAIVAHLQNPEIFPALNHKTGIQAFLGREKLVISPFVDDTLLSRFRDKWTQRLDVFSRTEQLDLLKKSTIADARTSFKAFDEIDVSEPAESIETKTGPPGAQEIAEDLTGLHAKAFFCDYDHFTYALLGSANATEAAFTRNVEFLLEMRGAKKQLGVERIRKSLEDVPFTDYLGTGGGARCPEDEATFRLANALREAAARTFLLDAVSDDIEHTTYRVTVTHDWSPNPEFDARLTLLTVPQLDAVVQSSAEEQQQTFHGIPLADVTPYLVLTLEDPDCKLRKSTVVQGCLRTDPEGRTEEIIARQLDDPEKLRQFLLLFLTPEDAPPGSSAGPGWFLGPGFAEGSSAGLFEALIGAVSGRDAPAVFAELKVVMDRLLAQRGHDRQIQLLHSLWTAAVEALDEGEHLGV